MALIAAIAALPGFNATRLNLQRHGLLQGDNAEVAKASEEIVSASPKKKATCDEIKSSTTSEVPSVRLAAKQKRNSVAIHG